MQIAGDGTFNSKPRPYHKKRSGQLWTLNTYVGNATTYTRLYMRLLALLPSKSEACYRAMFDFVLARAWELYGLSPYDLQWKSVVIDFETAPTNVLQEIMRSLEKDELSIERCHMHYCSALMKALIGFGMKVDFMHEDSGLRHYIGKLFALAFAPADSIRDLYWWMKENKVSEPLGRDAKFQLFSHYYETYWLRSDAFINEWCVYLRGDFAKRTNNDLEGKHRHYVIVFGIHIDLWTFFRTLIDMHEINLIEENGFRLGGNAPTHQAARVRQMEKRLQTLKNNLKANNPITLEQVYTYVKSVAVHMRQYCTVPQAEEEEERAT